MGRFLSTDKYATIVENVLGPLIFFFSLPAQNFSSFFFAFLLGFVKRRCEADSRWLPPNFSDCVSNDYQALFEKVKQNNLSNFQGTKYKANG